MPILSFLRDVFTFVDDMRRPGFLYRRWTVDEGMCLGFFKQSSLCLFSHPIPNNSFSTSPHLNTFATLFPQRRVQNWTISCFLVFPFDGHSGIVALLMHSCCAMDQMQCISGRCFRYLSLGDPGMSSFLLIWDHEIARFH